MINEAIKKLENTPSKVVLRPRIEGNNIMMWIGFKHVMYLAEEAILNHFREAGLGARALFEQHGLSLDLVASSARILHVLHVDDEVHVEVRPRAFADRAIAFEVRMFVPSEGDLRQAYRGDWTAVLRRDDTLGLPAVEPATPLATLSVPRALRPGTEPQPQRHVPARNQRGEVLPDLLAGKRGVIWQNRIPYFYCHANDRLRMSGYVRLLEEAEDLFLEHCGISINTLLSAQRWIPVVPSAKLDILAEAYNEETLYVVYALEEVTKSYTYTCSMNAYCRRADRLEHVARGEIVHGYARIDGRNEWSLVRLSDAVESALRAPA